jgi:hypothetical protein
MKSALSLGLILFLAGSAFPANAAERTRPLNESARRPPVVRSTPDRARPVTDSKQIVETIPRSGRVRAGTRVHSSKRTAIWVVAAVVAAGVVAFWLLRVERCNEQVC